MTITVERIREELTALSGSGKRLSTQRRNGLYSSITIDDFEDMKAVRDTKKRFADFGVPDILLGKTVLDLGSNVGAMSFEAAIRGATVDGVEFNNDRVALCNLIATQYELNAMFYQVDFNLDTLEQYEWHKPHDIVLCSSVDEYIENIPAFYMTMRILCKETLYFECNVQKGQSVQDTVNLLTEAGFHDVHYLGNGNSGGISRKRKIYSARGEV